MIIHAMQSNLNGVAPLAHLGVIRAEGTDAASFLHGQLTQDFVQLGSSDVRLAALCTAQGRMLASFYGIRQSSTEIYLICCREVLPDTLKHLSRFILRAKVRLTDISASCALYGLAGEALEVICPAQPAPWTRLERAGASLIFLPRADGVARALWLASTDEPAPAGPDLSMEAWCWGEVRSGIAMVGKPVTQAFVPQMLNYESVGGVNFKKGCYPGQEVVARSQFRGIIKRRAFLAHCPVALKAGDEVFQTTDAVQPCGLVAQAAASPSGGFDAIVSLLVTAVQAGDVHLAAPDGPKLTLDAAPYPLLSDI